MKVYYKEFTSLTDLNEYICYKLELENIISINYVAEKHCM